MRTFDPVAFGQRLRAEIDRRVWDVKTLQQELARRVAGKRAGTSYGSVWSYVNGQAPIEPRPAVLQALADIFGVNLDWLAYGEWPRTDSEAMVDKAAEASRPTGANWERDFALELKHVVFSELGLPEPGPGRIGQIAVPEWVPYWVAPLAQVWHERIGWVAADAGQDDDISDDVMHQIGRALAGPLEAFDIRAGDLPHDALHNYILAMAPVLLGIARRPTSSFLASLDQED